jgi:hypothetical protein
MQCRPQVDALLDDQEKKDEWWQLYSPVLKAP